MFIIPVTFSWSGIRSEGHGCFLSSIYRLEGSWYECKEEATGRQFRGEVFVEVSHPLTKGPLSLRAFNRSEARSPCYHQFEGFGHVKYTFNLNITQYIKLCVLKIYVSCRNQTLCRRLVFDSSIFNLTQN